MPVMAQPQAVRRITGRFGVRRVLFSCLIGLSIAGPAGAQARNVVLFIADGLRDGMVNAANAPTMDRLMRAEARIPVAPALRRRAWPG